MTATAARARLCVGVLAVALLPLGTAWAAAADDQPTGTLLVAHRGSPVHAPENTLPALDRAVAEHADRVSIDVHLTSDGVPVVLHDMSLARTTNVERRFPRRSPWYVGDFTLAQVRSLDAGSWFGDGAFTGTRVPTLDEALTELGPSPTGLTVEVKNPAAYGGVNRIGKAVMDVVAAHAEWASTADQTHPRLVLESFDWGFLDDLHAAYPTLPLDLLASADVTTADLDAHPYATELDVSWTALTAGGATLAQDRGLRVGTWTPNDTTALNKMIGMGLDLITTDQAERLAGLLSAAHRGWTGTAWPSATPRRLTLSTPASATIGSLPKVRITALDASGRAMPWQPVTLQRLVAGSWRDVAAAGTDAHGGATLAPRVPDGLVLRAVSGAVSTPATTVPTHIAAAPTTTGRPAPAVRLAAQPRRATPGARPAVSRLSAGAWRTMAGRSYRYGCPVTRDALRRVSATYWGFDGYRHRGSLVVARRAARPLGRVLSRLYDEHLQLRTLRQVEQLGSYRTAVGRGLAGDATFGFGCHPMPGDRAVFGSHSRGLVVSVNPWENPTVPGAPNSAWLDRSLSLPYVHRTGSTVVKAFAAEGFAWRGGHGRNGEFRYVR